MLPAWCLVDLGLPGSLLFCPGVFFELVLDLFLGIGVKGPRDHLAPFVAIQEPINYRVMESIPESLFKNLSHLGSPNNLPFLSHSHKRSYKFSFLFQSQVCVSSAPASGSFHYPWPKPIVIRNQIMNRSLSHPHMDRYFLGWCRINRSVQYDQPFLRDPRGP